MKKNSIGTKMRTDMKNILKFFAAALAIVAAASCVKENNPELKLVHKVFSVSLNEEEQPEHPQPNPTQLNHDSKTTLHTDGKTVHWTAGDKIVLLPSGSTNLYTFSIVDSAIKGTIAAFEGNAVEADSYVGFYPAEAYDYTQSSWDGSIIHYFRNNTLSTQYAKEGDFPTTNYGNANIAISTTTQDEHLYFQNANAYLKFSLSFAGATEIIVSADAISNDDPATGNTSTILNLGATLRYKNGYIYGSSGDVPITVKIDDSKSEFVKDAVYYVAIPAVYIKGLRMTVKDVNGKVLASFSKVSDFTAKANKIYKLDAIEGVKVGDFFYSDGTFSTRLDNSKTVVGVVFYVGDPTADDSTLKRDYPNCTHGLVVGLDKCNGLLASKVGSWETPEGYMTTIGVYYSKGVYRMDPAGYLKTGYNNTKVLGLYDSDAPSISFCNSQTRVEGASTWFMPTIAECDEVRSALSVVNTSLKIAEKTMLSGTFWTVSEEDGTYAAKYNIETGALSDASKRSTADMRVIFAF